MAEMLGKKWWAWQGLNLRPLRCQGRVTRVFPQKPAVFCVLNERTWPERMRNLGRVYRTFTAQAIEAGTDETLQAAQPEGQERGPKGAPILHQGEASNG